MTKEEYNKQKQLIIDQLGQPEYDYDRTALNESAKALNELKGKHLADARANKKLNNSVNAPNPLEQVLNEIPEARRKEYKKIPLPEIIVLDKDLKGFSEIERSILKDYFSNLDQEPKTLANKYAQSYQFVAGLLRSKDVQFLRTKYFNEILNVETMKSILRAVKAGDSRTLEGATEYLKLMSNSSDGNNGSKPIEDKQAEQRLKQLGDELASEGGC